MSLENMPVFGVVNVKDTNKETRLKDSISNISIPGMPDDSSKHIAECTSRIVAAYAASNQMMSPNDLVGVIKNVYFALDGLTSGDISHAKEKSEQDGPLYKKMGISIEDTVTDNYIICLEDNKKLKMLKRHLMAHCGMTVEEYKKKWGLPPDYPVVAPNYARKRSSLAKGIRRRKTVI